MTWYADNTSDMFKLIELLKQKYTDVRFSVHSAGKEGWTIHFE